MRTKARLMVAVFSAEVYAYSSTVSAIILLVVTTFSKSCQTSMQTYPFHLPEHRHRMPTSCYNLTLDGLLGQNCGMELCLFTPNLYRIVFGEVYFSGRFARW